MISDQTESTTSTRSTMLTGIVVGGGVALGPAFIYEIRLPEITPEKISDPHSEIQSLKAALAEATSDLESLKQRSMHIVGKEEAQIFEAQKLIANDPELFKLVENQIQKESVCAAFAWRATIEEFVNLYKSSKSPVMAERSADVLDVGLRVIRKLVSQDLNPLLPEKPSILVTDELSPSDTASIDPAMITGVICESGSNTSHSAILVRSIGIPAVFGVQNAREKLARLEHIIVDGDLGKIYLKPDEALTSTMQKRRQNWLQTKKAADKVKHHVVHTSDGEKIEVLANVSEISQVSKALENGAGGIGLYRTEYVYMDRKQAPSEDEQYEIYREAVELMPGKPVTFRTMDIGGDKPIDYLSITKEANPFMGWRGIRFSLHREDVFRVQLRAILRASAHGNIHIMFPMISTLDEWHSAKSIVDEEKLWLKEKNIDFGADVSCGIMVEVPSVAVMIDDFLDEVDFISIGTNDLTQYLMAADRMNSKVAKLASYHQPAVLKVVELVIRAAVKKGVPVSMCGEMARDTEMTETLLRFGLRSFSMSASGIPAFKHNLLR